MAKTSKQEQLFENSFYILQNPSAEVPVFYIGALSAGKSEPEGAFVSYDAQKGVSLGEVQEKLSKPELMRLLGELSLKPQDKLEFQEGGFEAYQKRFENLQKTLESSELQKGVLYEKYVAKSDFIEVDSFLNLLKTGLENGEGYLYAFYDPLLKRAFLGLSPEYLFKAERDVLITTATAGTKEKTEKSHWDKKLVEEHKLVERSIEKKMDEELLWSDAKEKNFGLLKHLVSYAELSKDQDLKDLSLRLHPTAAIGTLPYEKSWTTNLGPAERSFYGGYVEFHSISNPFSLVTIRGFEWREESLQVCIGGGVVLQSELQTEWKELGLKWESFQKTWGLKGD